MNKNQWNGQAGQDLFVLKCTNYKKNGTFVEIGSNDPVKINNSYLLETTYNWRGIMVEYEPHFLEAYRVHRPNSRHCISDATKIQYAKEFALADMPSIIDYLQIDLEVTNKSTLTTLQLLDEHIMNTYTFGVITFEHDIYRGDYHSTQTLSREILERRGYCRVVSNVCHTGKAFEDWWIHPTIIDVTRLGSIMGLHNVEYSTVLQKLSDL